MMHVKNSFVALAIALVVLHSSDSVQVSAKRTVASSAVTKPARIKFNIVAVEERGSQRNVISESTIDGPPNTDFNIYLNGEHFRMTARFLTDFILPNRLRIRTRLDTRRLYGTSENNLPLYEEDEQTQSLDISFDEALVLLPFGRTGSDHRLKMEITPVIGNDIVAESVNAERPLEIAILKPSPGGIVQFEAMKRPHNFVAEIAISEQGRELANNVAPLLIEEERTVLLQGKDGWNYALGTPMVTVVVDRFLRNRPADEVGYKYEIHGLDNTNGTQADMKGAGVAALDPNLNGKAAHKFLIAGRVYELTFRFKLAAGEGEGATW
jgi:hypothetical protein